MNSRILCLTTIIFTLACGALMAADTPPRRVIVDDIWHSMTTMRDMYSLSIAIRAWQMDHGALPQVKSTAELGPMLAPAYMRTFESNDAWGTPIRYVVSPDGKTFMLVSAGSDKTFDEASWSTEGVSLNSKDDAVYGGHFVRKWAIDIP